MARAASLFSMEHFPNSQSENWKRCKCGDFVAKLGKQMSGEKTTIHAAMVLCQKFFCFDPKNTIDYRVLAAACFWLAAAGMYSMESIAKVASGLMNEDKLMTFEDMHLSLLKAKTVVTNTLLDINVDSTHQLLTDTTVKITEREGLDPFEIYVNGLSSLEDLYKTPISVIVEKPKILAAALMDAGLPLTDCKDALGVDINADDLVIGLKLNETRNHAAVQASAAAQTSSSMAELNDIYIDVDSLLGATKEG